MNNKLKAIRNILILATIVGGFGFIYGFDVGVIPIMGSVFLICYVFAHEDLVRGMK